MPLGIGKWIMGGVSNFAGSAITGGLNIYGESMVKSLGKTLSGKPSVAITLYNNGKFLGKYDIETFIYELDYFFETRKAFEGTAHMFYRTIIETYYYNLIRGLNGCKNVLISLNKVKSTPNLLDYKVRLMKNFNAVEKVCEEITQNEKFKIFKLDSIIENTRKFSEDIGAENKEAQNNAKNDVASYKALKAKGGGTFIDCVENIKNILKKSIENLKENNPETCAVYINLDNGEWDVHLETLGVTGVNIDGNANTVSVNEKDLLKRKINENNSKRSEKYVKNAISMDKLCVKMHDDLKEIYYEASPVCENMKLECSEKIKNKLKGLLDNAHLLVFGSAECLCSEYSNVSGLRNIRDAVAVCIKGLLKPLCKTKDSSHMSKDSVDILLAKRNYKIMKDIYIQLKRLKPLALKLYKDILKIEKEYKSKMDKIEKLIVECKGVKYRLVDKKVWEFYRNFDSKITQAENLEDLSNALNECIKRLKMINKFKKEILSGYIALEKSVEDFKRNRYLGGDPESFTELKRKIKNCDFKENVDFSDFEKSLNEAKKAVNEEVKNARKAAKNQKKQNRSNSARGNPQPSVPAQ